MLHGTEYLQVFFFWKMRLVQLKAFNLRQTLIVHLKSMSLSTRVPCFQWSLLCMAESTVYLPGSNTGNEGHRNQSVLMYGLRNNTAWTAWKANLHCSLDWAVAQFPSHSFFSFHFMHNDCGGRRYGPAKLLWINFHSVKIGASFPPLLLKKTTNYVQDCSFGL